MQLIQQILSKPDLISQATKRLAEEARARVETYASTLIEPPVGMEYDIVQYNTINHSFIHILVSYFCYYHLLFIHHSSFIIHHSPHSLYLPIDCRSALHPRPRRTQTLRRPCRSSELPLADRSGGRADYRPVGRGLLQTGN